MGDRGYIVDQEVALSHLHSMLEAVRSYEKVLVSLIDQEDKQITFDQISNLYGYAEDIAAAQRNVERDIMPDVLRYKSSM